LRGEPKVIEYLNAGLRHELTAVNQYWLHYRLLDNWGYNALAKHWRKESIEKMQHADDLITRMIFLEGSPHMQLDLLHIGLTQVALSERFSPKISGPWPYCAQTGPTRACHQSGSPGNQ
jgi:bacterioferritin